MIAFPVVWFIVNMFFATSRPRPLNLEPLYVLSSFQLSELQSALGDEHNNFFQETLNLYHILKPIIVRLFRKNLFPDVHFEAVSLIHSGLQRNAATLRKVLAN